MISLSSRSGSIEWDRLKVGLGSVYLGGTGMLCFSMFGRCSIPRGRC